MQNKEKKSLSFPFEIQIVQITVGTNWKKNSSCFPPAVHYISCKTYSEYYSKFFHAESIARPFLWLLLSTYLEDPKMSSKSFFYFFYDFFYVSLNCNHFWHYSLEFGSDFILLEIFGTLSNKCFCHVKRKFWGKLCWKNFLLLLGFWLKNLLAI